VTMPDAQYACVTREWQSAVALPPAGWAEDVAERLVLLAHYGADFSVWSGARRARYWDALTERVKAATYAGPGLADWWRQMSVDLPTAPRNAREREAVARLVGEQPARGVLRVLRGYPEVVVLRVRVIAEARRDAHERSSDVPTAPAGGVERG